MPQLRLPHFILIGAMKSATTSLQEQLEQLPGIFMCEPKEPNFFSDDDIYRRGLDWYAGLFATAPAGALLGEASTHYTKLPTHPRTIERMREHVPGAKLVYVMRHPVDRLVSQYIHEWTMRKVDCCIDEAISRLPELIAYSRYAMQLQPYFDSYGREAVLPVFFDRLLQEPAAELARVCRFIGYPGEPRQAGLKPSNVSSARLRRLPGEDLLVRSSLATWLRRALIPKSWRERVKAGLVMRERPQLSDVTKAALEEEFNRDLAVLGQWLGTPLDCRNFKVATAGRELDWVRT